MIVWFFRKFTGILLLFGLCASAADAGIYQCRDQGGKVIFQDRQCRNEHRQIRVVREKGDDAQSTGRFLWKATSGAGELYLFGSIHFGNADMYPLDRVVTDAFSRAEILAVEANVLKMPAHGELGRIGEHGIYRGGNTLRAQVGDKIWLDVVEAAKRLGAPAEMFAVQKPWLAALTLTALSMTRSGYSEDLGVDRYFLREAGTSKEIVELESVEQQVELLAGLSEDEAALFLSQTLRDLEKGDGYVKQMFSAWKRGDLAWFETMLREGFDADPASKKLYAAMFTDRNVAMAERLETLAKDGRTYFVVVGAGHLVGDGGLVRLLAARGFKVDRL